jgi:hypothetical protein
MTFHLPIQKSNCLNSGERHAGGGAAAGCAGLGEAARPIVANDNDASSNPIALKGRRLKKETVASYFLLRV